MDHVYALSILDYTSVPSVIHSSAVCSATIDGLLT